MPRAPPTRSLHYSWASGFRKEHQLAASDAQQQQEQQLCPIGLFWAGLCASSELSGCKRAKRPAAWMEQQQLQRQQTQHVPLRAFSLSSSRHTGQ